MIPKNQKSQNKLTTSLEISSSVTVVGAMPHHRKSTKNIAQHEKLKTIVENLQITGRIVNMVALRRQLEFGNLKLKNVVRELLNYSESLDSDAVEKTNIPGLTDKLAKLITVVKTNCDVKGEPCKQLKVVADGGKYLLGMEPLPQNFEVVETLGQVKGNYDSIKDLKSSTAKFEKHMSAAFTAKDKDSDAYFEDVYDAISALRDILRLNNSLSMLSDDHLDGLEKNKVLKAIDDVLKMLEVFSDKNIALALEQTLKAITDALSKLGSDFSRGTVDNILSKAQLLTEITGATKLSFNEKKSTHGFPNGPKDFEQLPADLKTSFVTQILTNKEGFELVSSLVPFFSDLYKDLQSILETRNSMNGHELIHHVKVVKNLLDSAVTEVESLAKVIPKLYEHVKRLNEMVKGLKSIDWAKEKDRLNYVDIKDMKQFSIQTNSVSFKTDMLADLEDNVYKSRFVVTNWDNYEHFDDVKTELQNIITELNKVDENPLRDWAVTTDIKIISDNPLLKRDKIKETLAFLEDKRSEVKVLVDTIGDRTSFSNVLKVTSTDKSISEVMKSASASKTVAAQYIALDKSLSSKKVGSFKETEEMKAIDLQVNKDFNEGVMVLYSYWQIDSFKDDLKKLKSVLSESETQAFVKNLSPDAQKEFDKLLGPEKWKQIDELIEGERLLVKNITEVPRNITGYAAALKIAPNQDVGFDINLQSAFDFLRIHNAPKPILDTIADVEHIQMSFANGHTQRGVRSFEAALPFLLSLSAAGTMRSTSLAQLSAFTQRVVIVVTFFATLTLTVFFQGAYEEWRQPDQSENFDDTPMTESVGLQYYRFIQKRIEKFKKSYKLEEGTPGDDFYAYFMNCWARSCLLTPQASNVIVMEHAKSQRFQIPLHIHSRFKLLNYKNQFSDGFIHASKIEYPSGLSLILTQGPVTGNIAQFWWMAKQAKSKQIVMLTQFEADGVVQCDRYFPDGIGQSLKFENGLTVTCVSMETEYAREMEIRELEVRFGNSDPFTVIHYQYLGWVDQGIPENIGFVYSLLVEIRTSWEPVIVHCSDGAGRSGCFAYIEYGYQLLSRERDLDFMELLDLIRSMRAGSISNAKQLGFCAYMIAYYVYQECIQSFGNTKDQLIYEYLKNGFDGWDTAEETAKLKALKAKKKKSKSKKMSEKVSRKRSKKVSNGQKRKRF